MKYACVVLSVADIRAARKFYEDLFGLEVYQDYGRNVSFTCGISLQQDFDWLVQLPKEKILREPNNVELAFEESCFDRFLDKLKNVPNLRTVGDVIEHDWGQRVIRFYDLDGHLIEVGEEMKTVVSRFLAAGMSMEEVSEKIGASVEDVRRLLQS